MGIHIAYEGNADDFKRKPGDAQRARIKAKLELWKFIDETIEEILSEYLGEEELARELISMTIWMLHPHYEGPELVRETQLVLKSLKVPVPHPYVKIFTESFERIVLSKLQGGFLRNERNKEK